MMLTGCGKQDINLSELLESKQWKLSYYKVQKGTHTYYATEYQYRIQFRKDNKIVAFKQSGDAEYGNWTIFDNKRLDINMNREKALPGKWEMINYEVWGYDQDRLTFKCDTLEMGIKGN
jgi:hypothetical protein